MLADVSQVASLEFDFISCVIHSRLLSSSLEAIYNFVCLSSQRYDKY
jgi:hypothetical protein